MDRDTETTIKTNKQINEENPENNNKSLIFTHLCTLLINYFRTNKAKQNKALEYLTLTTDFSLFLQNTHTHTHTRAHTHTHEHTHSLRQHVCSSIFVTLMFILSVSPALLG